MFPPVPAPFAGSIPRSSHKAAGATAVILDCGLGALALLCAGAAASGVALGGAGLTVANEVKLVCAALLLSALFGMWLLERVQEAPSLAVTRIYGLVQYRLLMEGSMQAVPRHPLEDSYGGLAGLIADAVAHVRRLQAGRVRVKAADQALETGRAQASALAESLRRDASAMADAASGIMMSSAHLVADIAATRTSSETARLTVNQVIGHATDVAGSIGTITAAIVRMTEAGASAAQSAFGAHASVAGLMDRAAALSRMAEEAGRALGDCRGSAAPALVGVVEEAVAAIQLTVAELQAEASLAVRHVAGLSDAIQAQQDLGTTLSDALDRQDAAIGHVLILLQEAHAGLDRLRDGMDGVMRHGANRQAEAEAIRGAVFRLPAHADVIASLLKDIPDFTQPLEF